MKSWLKKTVSLGRKSNYDAVPSTAPTPERGLLGSNETLSSEATPVRLDMERAGGTQGDGKQHVSVSKTTSQRRHHSRGHGGGSGAGMVRQKSKASSHDLDMAVSAMQENDGGNVRDTNNKSAPTSMSSHQSHSSVTAGQRSATYSSTVVSSQHPDDATVARMVAEEERAYYASLQRAMAASMEQQQQQQQSVNGGPAMTTMDSSRLPDMNLAIALAESQFAARQADELVKARESVFEAAVSKAMEESISSADYDHLLRDIKMWTIDLDAASDDVVTALNMISKRRRELAAKLEKALEKGDTQRVAKMLWEEEKLPDIQLRIEELQENMVPIGLAASDLQALRKRIMETYPPIVESQKARDAIIEELFRALKNLKLKWSNPGSSSDYSIQTSEDCQDSSELRDLIVSLVEDAKRIPKVPDKVMKEAKVMVHTAFAEQQASVDAKSDISDVYSGRVDNESTRAPSECKTEVSSTPTEMQHLVKSSNVDSSVDVPSDIHVRSSSNEVEIKKMKSLELKDKRKPKARPSLATVPQPFNLSQNRPQRSSTSSKQKSDLPIRRVPAFFTLHHEILSDRGVVNQTVDWQGREYSIESFASQYLTVPAPVNVDEFYSEDVHELVDYVKKHAKSFGKQLKSANIPSSSVHEEKWYTMCEVAGAVEGLEAASERFLTWNVPDTESITESCHSLKAIVSQTLSIIADTAYAHDSLRVAIKKHKLPWKESLISQVRWDAQHAAFVIMRAAIDCAEEAERKRGAFKRQKNVLKPLGQAVIATFSVHQFSGGFGGEAAEICDQLVELTVHYARQLDPKWFRGTKVVRS